MNKRGMIKKAVVSIIVIVALVLVGVLYVQKSGAPNLEQLVEGEYSYIYDTDVREALEDAFAQRPDELEWVWWDGNLDGEDDLILQEKIPCADGMKRIQGVFCVSDKKIICVMWDDVDVTEFYSVCNNKLVYYSQYLGTYTQKVYEVCEYDCDWNRETVSGLEFLNIENMAEMPTNWTTEHPDIQAEGAYYQKCSVAENGEKVYTFLTVQEWCEEFENLLGLPAPAMSEADNIYFYPADSQYLTATAEYFELETRTEKEIVAEIYLVKEYEQGNVYKFAIEPIGYLGEERTNIYFYVTSDKIYRLYSYVYQDGETIEFYDNDELLVQYLDTDAKLIENGTVVCQPEGTTELNNQEAAYSISVDGDRVVASRSDEKVNGERGFYERFVWEEGKGLVEYGSGFGVEADILYLSRIEAVAKPIGVEGDQNINTEILFEDAYNLRIEELLSNVSSYVGDWECAELILPMAIGQDSTRDLLGIDLEGQSISINEDLTVTIGEEVFVIADIAIRDYGWYLSNFRSGPHFAEGIVAEVFYENGDKHFSICYAENGMWLFSYAFGFYEVKAKELYNVDLTASEELVTLFGDAYRARFAAGSFVADNVCEEWVGRKYQFYDDVTTLEGNYSLTLSSKGTEWNLIFEGESMDCSPDRVIVTNYYMQEKHLQDIGIPSEIIEKLTIYEEAYVCILQQDQQEILLVLPMTDKESVSEEYEINLFLDGEIYLLEKI